MRATVIDLKHDGDDHSDDCVAFMAERMTWIALH